jgi:hypothetical protein
MTANQSAKNLAQAQVFMGAADAMEMEGDLPRNKRYQNAFKMSAAQLRVDAQRLLLEAASKRAMEG